LTKYFVYFKSALFLF